MANEGFEVEEWDADFLDQLVQAEELALSSATQLPPPPPPQTAASYTVDVSYSPPRELSQRVVNDVAKGSDHSSGEKYNLTPRRVHSNSKDQEIDRLKKELGRVSKQLTQLEQECLKLRKERDKKEEQLKCVDSRIQAKDSDLGRKNTYLSDGVNIRADPQTSLECQHTNFSNEQFHPSINVGTSSCKAVGVQTDNIEATNGTVKCNLPTTYHCSEKLISLWDSKSGPQSGRILASKLLVSCEADFRTLFGCMNLSFPCKGKIDSSSLYEPRVASGDLQSGHSAEAAKISHLYSTLSKFSEETVRLEDMLEALISLCRLESVNIVHRSLCILHVLLKYSFSRNNYDRRDDVIVEEPCSDNIADEHEYSIVGSMFCANAKEASWRSCNFRRPEPFDTKVPLWKYMFNHSSAVSSCQINWISLFELMCQILRTNREEYVRLEAISIMNIILIRSNAYIEREKFASEVAFQSISQLLRKEAGSSVQTQALRLLYLLLNCPKVMAMFSSMCKEEVETAGNTADTNANSNSAFQGFSMIFEGLADCIACSGTGAQELKLRRNAIILLAFLASSGKSSFEILFSPSLSKMTHLLATILRGLTSDMDQEALDPAQPPEVFKERTLLMRETLILLNRLVSHPRYSGPVLRALTSRRDMASLTIDIANRLSVKGKCSWKDDTITRQNRESEICELGRVFKKRVFAFLGESIS